MINLYNNQEEDYKGKQHQELLPSPRTRYSTEASESSLAVFLVNSLLIRVFHQKAEINHNHTKIIIIQNNRIGYFFTIFLRVVI